MKLFFAGSEAFPKLVNKYKGNMLMSYFHIKKNWKENPKIKEKLNIKGLLFIDSGAFSAFSLGKETDIDKYIAFCKDTDADYYSVLDVIGSAEGTLNAQKYMESKGTNPIPCFHYGEDFKYLDYYCKNYNFIALGGMVPIPTKKLIGWLDVIFSKYPKKNFHGFGLTTNKLVQRYPWFSVDSSSWIMGGKTGQLYDIELGTKHYKKLNQIWKIKLKKRNIKYEELCNDYNIRNEFNLISYLEMQNNHNITNFRIKQNQLTSFGFGSQTYKPSLEELKSQAIDIWIKENYPNTPKELALKLWRHQQ